MDFLVGFLVYLRKNPKVAGAILAFITWIGSVAGGFWYGYQEAGEACELEKKAALERAIKQAEEQAEIDREIMAEGNETEKEIEVRYVTVEKEIEKFVPVDDCTDLGDEFVRLFNSPTDNTDP